MKWSILFLSLCFWATKAHPDIHIHSPGGNQRNGLLVEDYGNGTTYRFSSLHDHSVITVLENGDVIADVWRNLPTQKWTVVQHPRGFEFVELKQKVVPYNMLSGYEPIPEEPEIYPRPLILTKHRIMPTLESSGLNENQLPPIPWQILIRSRWCLQSNGVGRALDMDDDCEYQAAPWQFWGLTVVEP